MARITKLTEADLNRLVKRVINEQTVYTPMQNRQISPQSPQPGGKPTPQSTSNNQHGPYCRIGQSKGIIKQHTVAVGGPDVKFGETGFGLFDDSGKLICKISTKYTQGGSVATPSNTQFNKNLPTRDPRGAYAPKGAPTQPSTAPTPQNTR